MLTIFKPWRSGLDLKTAEQSWEDAFYRHTFTATQLKLMNNFNLRYECLDARDDFHAELRRKEAEVHRENETFAHTNGDEEYENEADDLLDWFVSHEDDFLEPSATRECK